MTTATRKASFSAPVTHLHVDLSPLKQKTLCERIWEIFCCCCCKRKIEEDFGYHIEGKGKGRHWVMSPTPVSQPQQALPELQDIAAQICHELNEKDYCQVTNFFLTDMTQLTETQRSAAMGLLNNMRRQDAFLNPDKFLEIEGFPKEFLLNIRSVASLAKIYGRGQSLVYSAHRHEDLSTTRVLHLSLQCTYMISGMDKWGREPNTVKEWVDVVTWGVNTDYDPEHMPDFKDRGIPASPSGTFISTSEESSPTTPSAPWRSFPGSSSEDSLVQQFDQTSKDLNALKLEMLY